MAARMRAHLLLMLITGCSAATMVTEADAGLEPGLDAGVELTDAGLEDAGVDAGRGKAAGCASTFGAALTNAFGRVDGTVVAVVPPGDPLCALQNGDHVVVQVTFDGGVHRMVINVQSSFGDPRIKVRELSAPLPAPALEPGWHPGLRLDYPTMFDVHADGGWESLPLAAAAARVWDVVEVGAPISVYATSTGGANASSAHKVHRNGGGADGALVLSPTSATPRWVLFSFANQTF
jgi:hypothetical protein